MPRKFALVVCILATLLWCVSLVPAGMLLMVSPMMFDAPGATDNPTIWATLIALAVYPLVAVLSVVMAWWSFRRGRFRRAYVWALVPALHLLAIGGVLVLAGLA